jgi:hypothetical protein
VLPPVPVPPVPVALVPPLLVPPLDPVESSPPQPIAATRKIAKSLVVLAAIVIILLASAPTMRRLR